MTQWISRSLHAIKAGSPCSSLPLFETKLATTAIHFWNLSLEGEGLRIQLKAC